MRILIHDFPGHPPQVYLSRALARRGHTVLYLYADGFETPHGMLSRSDTDPPGFSIEKVGFGSPPRKHDYFARQIQEWNYGRNLVNAMRAFAPNVVVCANTPLAPLLRLQNACLRSRIPFVFWLMDIYSAAVSDAVRQKYCGLGRVIAAVYRWLEGHELRRSDHVVLISNGFRNAVDAWGVQDDHISTQPIWSALDDIPVAEKANRWSKAQGLSETLNLIYSGTLGHKHNPVLLVALAEHYRKRPDVRVVVISQGLGMDYLKAEKEKRNLSNLVLLPFQPYDDLPLVMASSDIMLTLLDADAGRYSTPSKVLTHLCAGRPQVAAVPTENRANEVILESRGGLTCAPNDADGFVTAVDSLLNDSARMAAMGHNARAYAEREFVIDRLAETFEGFIKAAVGAGAPVPATLRRSERISSRTGEGQT